MYILCKLIFSLSMNKMGTYKVRNEIETKRNEINVNETKQNQQKRNETKSKKIKQNETKSTK
jgi:hypothetical protein